MPWNPHNLTVHSGAPIAIGAPVSHVFAVEGTQHVSHRSFYGEHAREGLIELWWRPGEKPQSGDLFADVGDDAGAAVWLACHTVEAERTQHVLYGQPAITELWWPTSGAVRAGNLATQAGQPELSGFALTSHVFLKEGTQHVFFIASDQIDGTPVDGHVGELWWHSSDPTQVVDLTERAGGAPAPESASFGGGPETRHRGTGPAPPGGDIYAAQSVLRMPISTTSGQLLQRLEHTAARVPGLFAAMFAAVSRSKRVRRATGTVQVTAIGMLLAEQVSRSRRLPSRRARSSLVLHDVCPARDGPAEACRASARASVGGRSRDQWLDDQFGERICTSIGRSKISTVQIGPRLLLVPSLTDTEPAGRSTAASGVWAPAWLL
jgi:hypothetical protein